MNEFNELSDKARWELVDIAIKAFINQYPKACEEFFKEIHANKSEFGVIKDKELQKANYRCTLSFPVVRNANGDDDCLLPVIERYIPGFAKKDSPYYKEFIKRYPKFSMAEKL